MKSPNFENCQIGLSKKGKIDKVSESFASWVGKASKDLVGENFRTFFVSLEKAGIKFTGKIFINDFNVFYHYLPKATYPQLVYIFKI